MSASVAHSMPEPDVLGELLHSLSQPLTSLRCSLELSIEDDAAHPRESVAAALLQTERIIGVVRVMQEYLDFEADSGTAPLTGLAPAVHRALEELSILAEAREVRIHFRGTCSATLPISERRLLLALRYLIASVLEAQPARSAVRFLLHDRAPESVLTIHSAFALAVRANPALAQRTDPVGATLERVRIAIARRILESAGASLSLENAEGVILQLRVPLR